MSPLFDDISEPLPRRLTTGLVKLGTAVKSQDWKAAMAAGLTPTQGQVLALLRAREPRPVRLSTVAGQLAVTPATASDATSALVRKGLVTKSPADDDRRALALRLTEKGAAAAEDIAAWPDFLLHAVELLDAEEQAAFLRSLVKLIRTLQQRGEIPVSRMCVTCRYFRPNQHDDPTMPHHCAFVDAPFGDKHLRLDCSEQEEAAPEAASANWRRFLGSEAGSGDATGTDSL